MAMMAMTTSNSMRVKAGERCGREQWFGFINTGRARLLVAGGP
jgi:hypothetical protein